MIKLKEFFKNPYYVLLTINAFLLVYAFIIDTPQQIFTGLLYISINPSLLITDYVAIGGLGATLVNTALIGIITIGMLTINKVSPSGPTVMALWLLSGFSMFGKNLINIFPIFIGGWLFAKVKKEPVSKYSVVIILSTALAPIVSGVALGTNYSLLVSISLGVFIGIMLGFLMPPISLHTIKSHEGYNLYNVGFSGGILAMVTVSILRGFGMEFAPVLNWDTSNNIEIGILLVIIFAFLIILGIWLGEDNKANLKKINNHSGKLVTDYYSMYKETSYINMGIIGIFSTLVVLSIGGALNGGTVAGIFSVAGFGILGKNIKNITPIMAGIAIGALISVNNLDSPAVILAILFGTSLAPLAGAFGVPVGILAGILHINLVLIITPIHGGLNLYNNGLAAGLVAMTLLPLVNTFKKNPLD
jgi:hypothetical protein